MWLNKHASPFATSTLTIRWDWPNVWLFQKQKSLTIPDYKEQYIENIYSYYFYKKFRIVELTREVQVCRELGQQASRLYTYKTHLFVDVLV